MLVINAPDFAHRGVGDTITRMSKPLVVTVRCHFDGRSLVPDEPIDLPRGEQLTVRIETASSAGSASVEASANVDRAFSKWAASNVIDDPSLPADLSSNLDHHLYGALREED